MMTRISPRKERALCGGQTPKTMTNNLDGFMKAQEDFMNIVGISTEKLNPNSIHDAAIGTVEEAVEILRVFRTTVPWRRQQSPNLDEVFQESIDVFFYLLELWILMGKCPDDVSALYFKKRSRNIIRAKEKGTPIAVDISECM